MVRTGAARFRRLAGLLAAAAIAAPASAQSGARRALLVGIQDYPAASGWPVLRGCRADAESMQAILGERLGYASGDVILLTDAAATRQAILDAFTALIERCGAEDVLLFYFAGHGSQLPDDDGDEPDLLDETLVPVDASVAASSPRDIRDDELAGLIALANQRTKHVQLVIDACNSGTVARAPEELPVRGLNGSSRGLGEARHGRGAVESGSGWYGRALEYVALSACRSSEQAWECELSGGEGRPPDRRGLYTLSLVQELRLARGSLSCAELADRVRRRVQAVRPGQTPTLEGTSPRAPALGMAAAWSEPWVGTLLSPSELDAGLVNGLCEGAVLAVLPPGHPRDDLQARIGRVCVSAAGAATSRLAWLDGPRDGSGDLFGARCFLLEPGNEPLEARLTIACPDDSPLAALVESSSLLRPTRPAQAELVVALEGERLVVRRSGARSELLACAAGDEQALCADLEQLARGRRVRLLVCRESSPLLSAEAVLERSDGTGRPLGGLERDDAGAPVVRPGDHLGARLTNTSCMRVYATLLIISPDGGIGVLSTSQRGEPIEPGCEVRSDTISVFVAPGAEAFYEQAPDCYRWVVSTRPFDLSGLEQAAVTVRTRSRGVSAGQPAAPPFDLSDDWLTLTTDVRVTQR